MVETLYLADSDLADISGWMDYFWEIESFTLFPGESWEYNLPDDFASVSHVALTPRKILAKHGMRGMCVPNSSENKIKIVNNSKEVWNIKKNVQMADVRAMIEYKEALVTKVYDVSRKNLADFMPRVKKTHKSDFTNDVEIPTYNLIQNKQTISAASIIVL